MRSKLWISAIFGSLAVFFTAWFVVLMPWDKLPDPDAFYHAAMADMTWQQGPVRSFPWLDLTTLGSHFADQHYLLHVIQSPFVHFSGLAQGSRLSSLVLAVLCMMGIALIFRRAGLRPYWLWAGLLALAFPLNTRLVLGKATPLAVGLWFFGTVTAAHIMQKAGLSADHGAKRSWPGHLMCIAAVSCFFTLTHGGWIILPGSIILLMAGQALLKIGLEGNRLRSAARWLSWSALGASLAGVLLGIFLHPGRQELFVFLWLQVVKIGLFTPRSTVPMGVEWDSASPFALLPMSSAFGVIALLIFLGLVFARRSLVLDDASADDPKRPSLAAFMRLSIIWGPLVAVLAGLAIKSLRYAEYFQPAMAFWIAALAQLVDWRKLIAWLSIGESRFSRGIMPTVVIISLTAVLAQGAWHGHQVLHGKPMFMDDQYLGATQAISLRAQPGDRVYHSQWDEFPILFSRDQRLRYVAGLDPNFFYEASSTLATRYFDLAFHAASSTQDQAWQLIYGQLGAKFAMVDTIRWPDLAKLLESDPRYEKIGEGQGGRAYQLRARY